MGWRGLRNGVLLAVAVKENFEALVTMDEGMTYEQNLSNFSMALVVLHAPSNAIEDLRPLVPRILQTLQQISPGVAAHVS